MQAATGPADRLVAEVSIRSLAASLGVAKDTAARAVRRLSDLGVIEADQRRADSGMFQTGVYRLAVPTACLTVRTNGLTSGTHPTTRIPRAHNPPHDRPTRAHPRRLIGRLP